MLGRNNNQDSTLVVLKPTSRTKDGQDLNPHFQISKKVDGTWEVEDDQSVSSVSGDLVKVEVAEEEYKGTQYFRVKLYIKDGKEIYLIPFRFTIATRSLVNALLSLETFDNIEISFFKNKSGFDNFSVKQGGNRVSWKYELSDLPKAKETVFKGQKLRDYTELDTFYAEKVEELAKAVAKANNSTNKQEVEETEVVEEEEVSF